MCSSDLDHRELLRTHEKLRFEKLNLEQEHEFLKAINDDLRKKSSSYIAKRLLLSTYMPQVKSSNKYKKDTSSSSNNNNVKSNIVASSSSLDSTNDSLSQVTLEQENSLLKGIKRTTRSNNIEFSMIIVTTRRRIFLALVARFYLWHISR